MRRRVRRRAPWTATLLACGALAACGAAPAGAPPAGPARVAASSPAAAAPAPSSRATATAASTARAGSPARADAPPAAPPSAAPPPTFPPPAFAPPHERSAAEGDGRWVEHPGVPAPDGRPVLLRSSVHPHRFKKDVHVALVAFDLSRVELTLIAGKEDEPAPGVPPELQSGLVPPALAPRALAVFNGGWLFKHGKYGMGLAGRALAPPRDDACAVLLDDAGVSIAPWPELSGRATAARAWRQGPPCLLTAGALNPELQRTPNRWGLSIEKKYDIRRTALGLDASGRVLLFGLGEWLTAPELAAGMQAAGAVSALELDINWGYTRFLFIEQRDGAARLGAGLVKDIKHRRGEYVERPAARDFFVVALRP